jgi:hypothetical protein
MSGRVEVKRKGVGVRGWRGKKKEKRKRKEVVRGWWGKKKKERIYNGNRGRGRRKMGKEDILGVVKKKKK